MSVNLRFIIMDRVATKDGSHLFIYGDPGELIQEPRHGINIGDEIIQIGELTKNGKTSSSCRVQKFDKPVVYSGVYRPEDYDNTDFLAFLDPNVKGPKAPYYKVYIDVGHELLIPNYKKRGILIYHAVFIKNGT